MQPGSEHWIDWFHITMRVTVLQQQTKTLTAEAGRAETGAAIAKRIDSVKHLIWHGNVVEALDRLHDLLLDLSLIRAHSAAAEKLASGMTEFEIYIATTASSFRTLGSATARGNHHYGLCGIDNQPSSESTLRQEAANGVDATRRTPAAANANQELLNNELENVLRV